MTDDEKLFKEWIESHEGEEYCSYCIACDECNGGVVGGPDGPIYPPRCDTDIEKLIDTYALLVDINRGVT